MISETLQISIDFAVDDIHRASRDAGWWADGDNKYVLATKLALVHSEVSEALEGLRKGRPDDHLPQYPSEHVEVADAVIRLFDYAGARGVNLGEVIAAKLRYNAQRADHKTEARNAPGGKAF